jgi:protein-histidine pros-kinase
MKLMEIQPRAARHLPAGLCDRRLCSYGVVQANAREEIVQNARLMMEAALASRTYTNTQVKPLLETQLKYAFLPQTVPAYAATEMFSEMRKRHPDYGYKEATLNPTNPRDRAKRLGGRRRQVSPVAANRN